jgi:hypothetical protein
MAFFTLKWREGFTIWITGHHQDRAKENIIKLLEKSFMFQAFLKNYIKSSLTFASFPHRRKKHVLQKQ